MNREPILREGTVIRPFEARIISEELRERVQIFKRILEQKTKNKLIGKTRKNINA